MADVILFPNAPIISSSQVDPPDPIDSRGVIVDLEHEIWELQQVITQQAVELRRRTPTVLFKRCMRASALFLIFAAGTYPTRSPVAPHGLYAPDRAASAPSSLMWTHVDRYRGYASI